MQQDRHDFETHVFKIHGMDCADEVSVLKREIGPVVGGDDHLAFDILNGKMSVLPSENGVSTERVIAAVARTGMRAEVWSEQSGSDAGSFWNQWNKTLLTAASGIGTLLGVLAHGLTQGWSTVFGSEGLGIQDHVPLVAKLFYTVAAVAGVWSVLPKAWFAARRLRPDMNLLMVIAVVGAVAIGEWFEAATVAFLFAVSLALEAWSVGRARRAIAALMELVPTRVRLRDAAGEREVVPEEVAVGAMFIVRPGEKLPLDGNIRTGNSAVNQAPITGESLPVEKKPGDQVFAGTVNGDGVLEVESTKPAGNTTLANIVRLVEAAQSRRAPSEQWVERFARFYTPSVMALAVVVLLMPPLAWGANWTDWLYRALVLLVIACPCALVISTPVSIVAALTAAARNGVLIKGGTFVEAPARLKAIAFDKTGTLTAGKLRVVDVVPLSGHDEKELVERAMALEADSSHPLAEAIRVCAHERSIKASPATNVQTLQGRGVTGQFDGRPFWLGSHRLLEERGQETPEVHEQLERLSAEGKTVVVIGHDTHVCGFLALADTLRPDAKEIVVALKRLGIERIVMLTGDNKGTGEAIGRAAGVDEVRAELLPGDKVTAIEELVARYSDVAMVGDGVNDAPALARATIGLAMGAMGTDAAIETADIALMADDLGKIPWLIGHARRALMVIRQNIGFSLAVKAVFAGLTLFGFASLWAAIAADAGASLLVIGNGLRLLRTPPQT